MNRSLYDAPAIYGMLHDGWTVDLPFYLDLASRAEHTLEIGVGVGRVAFALARAGHVVHGVERDASMLSTCRARLAEESDDVRARVTLEEADACTMALDRKFELVIVPFNGITHHHDAAALAAFLSGVRRHLAPGGLFSFDAWIPDPTALVDRVSSTPRFKDPRTGVPARATERRTYDPISQVLTLDLEIVTIDDDVPAENLRLTLRQLFPEETRLLLEHHGFEVLHRTTRFAPFGAGATLAVEPPDERGEMLSWVCR